jgi:predicted esterase
MKIFHSINRHKYTLVLLHGMNMPIKELFNLSYFLQNNIKNLKIILPESPTRNISWPQGKEYNIISWYNYYTCNNNKFKHDLIDINHFNIQTERIYKILNNEMTLLNNKSQNIIIGGFSQGGTIAFNIGLNYNYTLGGIIGIHTIFMNNVININSIHNINNIPINNIPIYLFSGVKDNIYNINFQSRSLNSLREKKYKIVWNIEKNIGHCEYSDNEHPFILNSIKNILFI